MLDQILTCLRAQKITSSLRAAGLVHITATVFGSQMFQICLIKVYWDFPGFTCYLHTGRHSNSEHENIRALNIRHACAMGMTWEHGPSGAWSHNLKLLLRNDGGWAMEWVGSCICISVLIRKCPGEVGYIRILLGKCDLCWVLQLMSSIIHKICQITSVFVLKSCWDFISICE